MGLTKIKPLAEFKPSGGRWQNWTDDVLMSDGIHTSGRGLPGSGPLDRVAKTDVCSLSLNNRASNSGGVQGYYAPGNANARPGFAKGMGFRLSVVIDADNCVSSDCVSSSCVSTATVVKIHTGTVENIDPEPGQHVAVATRITSHDYMEQLEAHLIPACDVLQGVNEAEAIRTILDAMGKQPETAASIPDGPDSFAYWGDLIREDSAPVTELQRIEQSCYGTFYIKGDGQPIHEPRNEKRAVSGSSLTSDIDLTKSDLPVERPPVFREGSRFNLIRTEMSHRTVDEASTVVVAQLFESIPFETGTTTIVLPYVDPDETDQPVGAINLVTPVENTDYDFNTAQDGSGTDVSGSVAVTPTFCGSEVELEINNSAGVRVYPVTTGGAVLLQVRGVTVTADNPVIFEFSDATSISNVGEKALFYNLPYQSQPAVASSLAEWFRDTLPDDERWIESVTLQLKESDTSRAATVAQAEISDIVTVAETVNATTSSDKYFKQSESWDFEPNGAIYVTWVLAPADTGFDVTFGSEHLTTGGKKDNGALASVTTPSVQTVSGQLVLAWVAAKRGSSTNPGTPSTATGPGGATLTLVDDVVYDGVGTDRRRLWLYGWIADGSSGTFTFEDFNGTSQVQDRVSWTISQFPTTGGTVGAAVVQSDTNSGNDTGTISTTLAAFANAANRPAIGAALNSDDTMEAESGYTTLGFRSTPTAMFSAWHESSTDTSPSVTIPGASGRVGAISVEIKND